MDAVVEREERGVVRPRVRRAFRDREEEAAFVDLELEDLVTEPDEGCLAGREGDECWEGEEGERLGSWNFPSKWLSRFGEGKGWGHTIRCGPVRSPYLRLRLEAGQEGLAREFAVSRSHERLVQREESSNPDKGSKARFRGTGNRHMVLKVPADGIPDLVGGN